MPSKTDALRVQIEAGFDSHGRVPIADRPPSLQPLDFGETPLLSRSSSPVRQKSSSSNIKRITIGQPTAFRHLDTERPRRSLIPLQLEPVTLRESVVESDSDLALNNRIIETDHNTGRATTDCVSLEPQLRRFRKTLSLTSVPSASPVERHRSSHFIIEHHPRRPVLSSRSSSSSMRSMRRQASESHSSSSSSPHQSIDWSRLSRKRNSIWKSLSDNAEFDIEQEVLELNTIVEEIRSESSRSPDEHVSAVAPFMALRARSETLSDIGSAFARPRPRQIDEEPEQESRLNSDGQTMFPMENRLSRPFTAMPDLSAMATELDARPDSKRIGK